MPRIISSHDNDYGADRIWSAQRTKIPINLRDFATQASLEDYIENVIIGRSKLRNLGPIGRSQVARLAVNEWNAIPIGVKFLPLLIMRERGLMSVREFYQYAEEGFGLTHSQAEYRYRKWSGTEESIWDLKFRNMLSRREYSNLLEAKGLRKAQGYYRYRKHIAMRFGVPFRNWQNRKFGQKIMPKPRSRYKRQP